jgi:ketosteroid isomerase-like protein
MTNAPNSAEPRFNAPEDVAAIKDAEKSLANSIPMDEVMKHYADDAMVLDIFAPGIWKGHDEINAGFAPQMGRIKSWTHSVEEMTIATNGNFGCALMRLAFKATLQDGSPAELTVRQLDAFEKIDGQWKIVQEHISLPVDSETLQAIPTEAVKRRELVWSAKPPLEAAAITAEQGNKDIRESMEFAGGSLDPDVLVNQYGPGDDILLYDSLHPQALIGREEVRNYYAGMMNGYKDIKISTPHSDVRSDGSFGIHMASQDITLTANDGTKRNISRRQSSCMRRVGGKWYSILEMISYPIDMATNKAIIDGPGAKD